MRLAAPDDVSSASESQGRHRGGRGRLAWRVLFMLFAVAVIALIFQRARELDWAAVRTALGEYGAMTIIVATIAALGAHVAAACYDLIGRRIVGHGIAAQNVLLINAVAFPFSLNLGALVGGWGFRVRLYSRFGLSLRPVLEIIALAIVTNWSGYVLIAGLLLTFWPLPLPPQWAFDPLWQRVLGIALLAAVGAYLVACVLATRHGWRLRVRGVVMHLPPLPLGLLQLALSSTNWLLMSAALYVLLPGQVPFVHVATVMLICAVAGAALHVPGSLGVLEMGVLELLPTDSEPAPTLAAVLAFRALYYILPFVLGVIAYAALEWRAHRRTRRPKRVLQAERRQSGNSQDRHRAGARSHARHGI